MHTPMSDSNGLENRCALPGHRGFESHPLRCFELTLRPVETAVCDCTGRFMPKIMPNFRLSRSGDVAASLRVAGVSEVTGSQSAPVNSLPSTSAASAGAWHPETDRTGTLAAWFGVPFPVMLTRLRRLGLGPRWGRGRRFPAPPPAAPGTDRGVTDR